MPDAALVGGDPFEVEHLSAALAAADVVVADAFDAQLRRVDERRRTQPLGRLLVDPLPALVATVAGTAELPAVAALERSPERSNVFSVWPSETNTSFLTKTFLGFPGSNN